MILYYIILYYIILYYTRSAGLAQAPGLDLVVGLHRAVSAPCTAPLRTNHAV